MEVEEEIMEMEEVMEQTVGVVNNQHSCPTTTEFTGLDFEKIHTLRFLSKVLFDFFSCLNQL